MIVIDTNKIDAYMVFYEGKDGEGLENFVPSKQNLERVRRHDDDEISLYGCPPTISGVPTPPQFLTDYADVLEYVQKGMKEVTGAIYIVKIKNILERKLVDHGGANAN